MLTAIDPEIIAKIKRLELKTRFLVTDVVMGEYLSAFKGSGIEFEEVRAYVHGDDVRAIDWNVTARMQEPYVKVHREERELSVYLAVDVSSSMQFGTQGKAKSDIAAEVGAIFSLLAANSHDRVGLVCFTDTVVDVLPARRGAAHIWNIVRTLMQPRSKSGGTSLDEMVKHISRVAKRRSLCIVVSDFRHLTNLDALRRLAQRHQLVCVDTFDPRENQPVDVGLIRLRDIENQYVGSIDFSNRDLLAFWQREENIKIENRQATLRKMGASLIRIGTADDSIAVIAKFLRSRPRGRK